MDEKIPQQKKASAEAVYEEYSFPLLNKVAEHYLSRPHDVSETYLVCCQHMLEPQRNMFQKFIDFGFDPKKIIVLGKTYSTSEEVQQGLTEMGIEAIQPAFSGKAFDLEHQENIRAMLSKVPTDAPTIILDDGGQLITESLEDGRNILFAVEQTSSGFRKLEGKELPFSVLNVARSSTKLVQESPFIARHACERMRKYFTEKGIDDPAILVIGLGPVGECVREYFERENFTVTGLDSKHGHADLVKTINTLQPDVVIGATGFNVLSPEEIEKISIKRPLHFISVSSSDREFPVATYRKEDAKTHDDIQYKEFTFVNNGFPITFKGNKHEAYPYELEKTMCLLGGAVMHGATAPALPNGLNDLPVELENLVNS